MDFGSNLSSQHQRIEMLTLTLDSGLSIFDLTETLSHLHLGIMSLIMRNIESPFVIVLRYIDNEIMVHIHIYGMRMVSNTGIIVMFYIKVTLTQFNSRGKGKNTKKGKKGKGRNESYDLIVNIDLQAWNLTSEQVHISQYKLNCS